MFKDKPFEFIIFKKKRMHNVWTIDTYFNRGLAFRIMCNLIYYNLYSYLKPIFAILHQKEKNATKNLQKSPQFEASGPRSKNCQRSICHNVFYMQRSAFAFNNMSKYYCESYKIVNVSYTLSEQLITVIYNSWLGKNYGTPCM